MATTDTIISQLCAFHGILRSEIRAPGLPKPPANVLEILALRSMLIDMDPSAADGHADMLWAALDDDALRWLVYAATQVAAEQDAIAAAARKVGAGLAAHEQLLAAVTSDNA